ncbi:hypothetical protein BDZ85DRAFT_61924 [Elsinoe ampelina]|uniref:Secreted protein n=1 Tax=Elsinoe ampelina TaxID=302913 RepID=A0A6A6FZV2_9PEZI|nr:hypothetical protein BDZ85DRAFT_61924 [Elsinoe ampelina]
MMLNFTVFLLVILCYASLTCSSMAHGRWCFAIHSRCPSSPSHFTVSSAARDHVVLHHLFNARSRCKTCDGPSLTSDIQQRPRPYPYLPCPSRVSHSQIASSIR